MADQCSGCKYVRQDGTDALGVPIYRCHFNAPMQISIPQQDVEWRWPKIPAAKWCGDYQAPP